MEKKVGSSIRRWSLVVLAVSSSAVAVAEPFPLVSEGAAAVEIVMPTSASKQLVKDLEFFTNAVFRCTGASLPIVTTRTNGGAALTFDLVQRGFFDADDHEVMFPDDKTLLVRGTLVSCRWALNRILEKNFGCVFCFPGKYGTHYPQAKDVSVARVPFKGTASLKAERHLFAEDLDWMRAVGGRAAARHGQFYGHSLWRIYSPKRLRNTPLYDRVMPMLKDGARRQIKDDEHHTWQPCFSSQEGIAEAIRYLNEFFDQNPNEKVFSIAVNDMGGHCLCPECARVNGGFDRKSRYYPRYIDYSKLYYTWANKVAEGVYAKHPDVALGLLAYCEVTDPPPFKLHPILVPFVCTEMHQMMNETADRKRHELFAAWSDKAEHVANWGYDWGSSTYAVPRVYLDQQKKYFDMKTDGTCPHMDGYFGECQGLIGEGPKHYLFYKQMFDVHCDFKFEYDRWLEAVGGKEAAPFLRDYYRVWEDFWTSEAVRETGWYTGVTGVYFIYFNHSYLYAFDLERLERTTNLLTQAVEAVKRSGDTDQFERVKRIVAFHKFYSARMRGMGVGHAPARNADDAARFFNALSEISAATREKAWWGERVLETVGKPEDFGQMPFYRDAIKKFQDVAARQIDGNLMQLLNCAVAYFGRNPEVDAAVVRLTADETLLPEIRERLSTLAKVGSLPNLLDGVVPQKSLRLFSWDVPDMPADRKLYCTMNLTNHRVGHQSFRICIANWMPKMKRFRDGDEVFVAVGPGETKTVSFFCSSGTVPGSRIAVYAFKSDLAETSDLEVTDIKLCEAATEIKSSAR